MNIIIGHRGFSLKSNYLYSLYYIFAFHTLYVHRCKVFFFILYLMYFIGPFNYVWLEPIGNKYQLSYQMFNHTKRK